MSPSQRFRPGAGENSAHRPSRSTRDAATSSLHHRSSTHLPITARTDLQGPPERCTLPEITALPCDHQRSGKWTLQGRGRGFESLRLHLVSMVRGAAGPCPFPHRSPPRPLPPPPRPRPPAPLRSRDPPCQASSSPMTRDRIFKMPFASLSALCAKGRAQGRTQDEVDRVICWLTGYSPAQLHRQVERQADFEAFFAEAPMYHPNASLITGVVCGVHRDDRRSADAEDPRLTN